MASRFDWRGWLAPAARRRSSSAGCFPGSRLPSGSASCCFSGPRAARPCGRRSPERRLPAAARCLARGTAWSASRSCVGLTALFGGFAAARDPHPERRSAGARPHGHCRRSPALSRASRSGQRERAPRPAAATLDRVPAERGPPRVRATVRERQAFAPGEFIAATARLLPPPEAARPGGYDFARDAYFSGIGAVGSLVGRSTARPPPAPPGRSLRFAAAVDEARNASDPAHRRRHRRGRPARSRRRSSPASAGSSPRARTTCCAAAGIYHIVSISGLHMVLAAGTFFWLARALLASRRARRCSGPCKKIAAVVAMVGATAYCVFSGSDVATERSLIMILVMFGAVLVDRPALSASATSPCRR